MSLKGQNNTSLNVNAEGLPDYVKAEGLNMLTLYFGRSGARDKVFKVLRPLSNCQVKDRRLVIKWLYLYIVDGHFQLKVILTL